MNHGFIDGNKWDGFAVMGNSLDINGREITATQDAAVTFICSDLETSTYIKENLDVRLHANRVEKRAH